LDDLEVIFVNDGSTDDSERLIHEWLSDHPANGVLISQSNQKLSAARNAGLQRARGKWVTFSDPDDILDDNYFREALKFIHLHGHQEVHVLAAHQMILVGSSGVIQDSHPLRKKFERGSRIVDLLREPMIQLSSCSAFLRLSVIRDLHLEFDGRVQPHFEDGHFIGRLILESRSHRLGLMASAKYLYRTRADGSSLVQSSYLKPEKYTNILRFGYLDLLKHAAEIGSIPRWVENTVLYELLWYFRAERAIHSPSALAPRDVFDEFHELVAQIRSHLTDDAIRSFDMMWVEYAIRMALLVGYADKQHRPDAAVFRKVDEVDQEVLLTYWFTGEVPTEFIEIDGGQSAPSHETVQDYDFYGRTLIRRRSLWVPRGIRTALHVEGRRLEIGGGDTLGHPEYLTAKQIVPRIISQRKNAREPYASLGQSNADRARLRASKWKRGISQFFSKPTLFDNRVSLELHSARSRRDFANAWIFMDKNTDANDNAEHLYRHIKKAHPEINSWFVLDPKSGDWSRLQAEGFRLVAYQSLRWYALILNADVVASSHADHYVVKPLDPRRYGKPRFKFVFLQHGVIHNDLSRWLNGKEMDLFITTTEGEHAAVAGPGQYAVSDKEAVLTGLPRHDGLLKRRLEVPQEDRDLLVVMPTWREALLGPRIEGSNQREPGSQFVGSRYAKAFTALLSSERLAGIAKETNKRIAFMPHPNMRPHLADFEIPDYVQILDFATTNVQDVIARSSLMITDYSSLGFEAAFLDVPLIYFQFDRDEYYNGTQVSRPGYFEHARDGFGPVVETPDEAVEAVDVIASRGYKSSDIYLARTAATFSTRDQNNSERVTQAMLALTGRNSAVHLEPELAKEIAAEERFPLDGESASPPVV
jgi:CDP-glycerol glycerophosphotransferase (TagB/SpsB family)/glycosyltransferase involved in cell wall biosynthesis